MRLMLATNLVRLALVISVITISPRVTSAECIGPGPICQAFTRATVVAFVEVTRVDAAAGALSGTVHLRVIEAFKGNIGATIELDRAGGLEDFSYAAGQQVLVYLRMDGDRLDSRCSRTRQAAATDFEVVAVRALRNGGSGSLVHGSVMAPLKEGLSYSPSAADVAVTVRQTERVIARVTTDGFGRFELGWLAPGKYAIDIAASPFGRGRSQEIEVTGTSNCLSLAPIQIQAKR